MVAVGWTYQIQPYLYILYNDYTGVVAVGWTYQIQPYSSYKMVIQGWLQLVELIKFNHIYISYTMIIQGWLQLVELTKFNHIHLIKWLKGCGWIELIKLTKLSYKMVFQGWLRWPELDHLRADRDRGRVPDLPPPQDPAQPLRIPYPGIS